MSPITKEFTKEQLIQKLKHRISVASGFPDSEKAKMDLELARIALASLEAEAVADVVAWSSPNEERTCDIRMRRHDIKPGSLYTAPPAPEFYKIGDATMRHIFTPTGITDVSDMQAVFDQIETVLAGMWQPAPVSVPDDYFSSLVAAARVRADKAMRKFPQPNYVLNKVAEESGEVIKAVIHFTEGREEWQNVEGEIIDNLAMLIRLVMEGDQVIGFAPPDACRAAMLQGADGNSPVIPDGWVACSKRMPDEGSKVIVFRPRAEESNDPPVKTATYKGGREYYHGFDCYCEPTHWMPLPAAPQQEV